MAQPNNQLTVYKFLVETADRRSRKYKELNKELDSLCSKYGKDSTEVFSFFNRTIII